MKSSAIQKSVANLRAEINAIDAAVSRIELVANDVAKFVTSEDRLDKTRPTNTKGRVLAKSKQDLERYIANVYRLRGSSQKKVATLARTDIISGLREQGVTTKSNRPLESRNVSYAFRNSNWFVTRDGGQTYTLTSAARREFFAD